MQIEVDPDLVEKHMEKAVTRISKQVKIPGFRPGKANRRVIEQRFGSAAILQEALEELVPEVYNQALESEQIDAIDQPEFDLESTEPLIVKAIVPVRPEVDLGDYEALRAPREEVTVTQENVDEAIEAIRQRDARVDQMADTLRQHVPHLDEKYLAEELTTLDRQRGHTEVLLSALISGLTNVVAFTVDELGHHYTGVPGIEGEKINMHDVGHGKTIGGVEATEIRRRCRQHHMTLIDTIVSRLKSVPEGDGTMFDNTMIFYFPDGGETHHSHGTEFPFIILAGDNCLLDLGRRYIRLPYWGKPGHKTLGNWYTTLLNAYGHGIDHFGDIDTGLETIGIDQRGPIERFLS